MMKQKWSYNQNLRTYNNANWTNASNTYAGNVITFNTPEPSGWKCQLLGPGVDVLTYEPYLENIDEIPNVFQRWFLKTFCKIIWTYTWPKGNAVRRFEEIMEEIDV